jgi:hypothetical protein
VRMRSRKSRPKLTEIIGKVDPVSRYRSGRTLSISQARLTAILSCRGSNFRCMVYVGR